MPKLRISDPPDKKATEISKEGVYYKNRLPSENNADLRDQLSVLLANKIAPNELGKYLNPLAFSLGATDKTGAIKDPATYAKARAILTKTALFNQRPEIQKMAPKDRVTTFFDLHKDDKEIGDVTTTLRSMGSGVGANYNDSPLAGLGRFPLLKNSLPNSGLAQNLISRVEEKTIPIKLKITK